MYDQPYQQPQFQPPPPPRSRTGLIIGIVAGVIVLLLCLCGVGVFLAARSGVFEGLTGDPNNAKVGDCITETVKPDASDAKVVSCSKPEAKNKVVGIVPNVTESEFDRDNQTICDAFPEWENVIWLGRPGGNGKAICMAPNVTTR
jgi:hypothetical protein